MRPPGSPRRGDLAGSNTSEPRGSAPRERDHRGGDRPGPIPNPAVKPAFAESTAARGCGRAGRRARGGRFSIAPREARGGTVPCGPFAFWERLRPHERRCARRRRPFASRDGLPAAASQSFLRRLWPGARSEGSREGYLLWTLEGFWRSSIYCSPLLAIVCKAFSEPFIGSGKILLSVPPSVMKGLLLSFSTTAFGHFSGKMLGPAFFKSASFGKCCRSRSFALSLAPRCRCECGS